MKPFSIFDAYALRARLFPALIASATTIMALAVVVPWNRFSPAHALASAAVPILLFAMADLARRIGRGLELKLYAKWGGKPTVVFLRHSDNAIDADAKRRCIEFVSKKLGAQAPTAVLENENPPKADAYYERCGAWLRENTRDNKRFGILFGENITYGFRRNLYGLKWPALAIDLLIFLITSAYFIYFSPSLDDDFALRLGVLMIFSVAHGLYISWAVTEAGVRDAANIYARQLLLSCESMFEYSPKRQKK